MKSSSAALLGIGVLVIVIGLINHFVIKANPVAHTSIILGVIGVVLAGAGVAMSMTGSSK
jgi:hypothetical protein